MTTEHATNSFHRSDLTTLLPPLHSLTSFSSHDIDSISPSTPVTTSSSLSPSSSLAPPSSHVTETSINDFYVILPDHDFHEKTGGIIKRGILRSESLKGKFHRKLGSVDILKYSDAVQEHWIRKLYPSPREHMIYRKHPYDQNLRYIGVDIFHSTILDEMQNELSQLFRSLGARTVTWEGHPTMNVVYEAPNSMAPYIAPFNKHIFLPHLHSWKDMVKERLNESVERYTFQFTYLDDFNVNDDLILRVLGKMNISSHERKELFAQHQERHSITASGHDRHLLSTSVSESMLPSSSHSSHTHDQLGLFSPIRITIRIEYFSLLDYMTYNRSWIEINWTIHHVSTFLRMTNYRDLEDLFLENNIDGRSLLQLGLPIDLIQLPKVKEFLSKLNLTEERWRVFRSKIQKLGSVDHLEFLQQISQEECRVRAENERKLELMINAKNEFRQQHQRSQKKTAPVHSTPVKSTTPPAAPATSPNSTPATTVYKFSNLASPESSKRKHEPSTLSSTPMIHGQQEPLQQNQATSETSSPRVARGDTIFSEGIFELVMVGEGAVGKTSIMNRICRDEFHAIEKPTIGTKLMQHALGKLVLDVWDTGGQPAQHATMKARAKRADIILAIYDVSNRDSLITLKTIIAELFQIGVQPWTAVVLIGNKADVPDQIRQISLEEGLITARDIGCCAFFETSAKTGYNVKEALANSVLKCEQGRLNYLVSQPRASEGSVRLNHEYLSKDQGSKPSSSCAC